MKSRNWKERQKSDFYVNKAKKTGYLSRSAYKILEIEKKYQLILNSKKILELGSSPGSWSQVIFEINPAAKVTAFDILNMKFKHKNLYFNKQDFLTYRFENKNEKFNLILSDLAPNTIGHQSTDHLRIISKIEEIVTLLDFIALPLSSFVFKILKGSEERNIINELKKIYKKVSYFKPQASRIESSEIYIVAHKYIK